MTILRLLRSALRNLFAPDRADRRLDDEIAHALEVLAEDERAAGAPPDVARRRAALAFGGVESVKEEVRSRRAGWRIAELAADARFGMRLLGRDPSFTFGSLVTLALGIGATTAIFSVVSGLILRPLPFADPDRLVHMSGSSAFSARNDSVVNLPRYREASSSLEAFAAYEVSAAYITAPEGADRVMTVRVEAPFFAVLGVPPLRGRVFTGQDGPDVAVISEAFWRRRFGGDAAAIGAPLVLADRRLTIVGIMPDGFQFPYSAAGLLSGWQSEARTDLWRPFDRPPTRGRSIAARLAPGITRAAAEAELQAIARRLQAESPAASAGRGVYLEPLAEAVVPPALRRVLFMLFGAVGLLLALACANVASLSLVRAAARSREVAVRVALGASRRRLARQFLTESVCLAMAGGVAGLLIAWIGTRQAVRTLVADLPRAHEIALDWRVFAFLFAACLATGVAIGVAPAWFAARRDVQRALQASAGRNTMTAGQQRLRSSLVVLEIALAVLLTAGGALFARELVRLRQTDLGMVTSNVLSMHVGQPGGSKTDPRVFYRMADDISRLPGVVAAGFTQLLPLQNWGWTSNSSDFFVEGRPAVQPHFSIHLRYVTPGYFDALGIPIERGRAFTAGDTAEAPPVILINGTLARRYFPKGNPVGLRTNRGTIVGVVRDFRQVGADASPFPEIYFAVAQNWSQVNELGMTLVARTEQRPHLAAAPIRDVIRTVSPGSAIFHVRTMEDVVGDSLSAFTFYMTIMLMFAALALVLALSGTYGVVAFNANARAREFAIRIALGAGRRQVMRLVVAQGLVLTAAGLATGLAGAYLAAPLLRDLPVSIRPPDVVVTAPIAAAVATVSLVACLLPARRACRVNPMAVLRND
jgi:predicted permease